MNYLSKITLLITFVVAGLASYAQTDYTLQGAGNINLSAATWNPAGPPGTSDNIIIPTGATLILDQNLDINSITIQTGATIRTASSGTNTLNISGDLINLGTFDMIDGSGEVNVTFDNTSTAVISGSSNNVTFNDLTIDGVNLIVSLTFTVEGDFTIGATQPDIEFSANNQDLRFRGDFTLSNNASYSTTNSVTYFDGDQDQLIDLANGSATFYWVYLDNNANTVSRIKTFNGNLVMEAGGFLRIFDDANITDLNPGNVHTLFSLQADDDGDGTRDLLFDGSTLNLQDGEIRFGANNAEPGTINFGEGINGTGADVNIVLPSGTTFFEDEDIFEVDGNITVDGSAQLVLNGSATTGAVLTDHDNSHTLLVETNGDIYVRGDDNFPTSFGTYTFENNSIVRYDQAYAQTIRGEKFDGSTIPFSRVLIDGGQTKYDKTLATDEDLTMTDRFNIQNNTRFRVGNLHAATIEVGEWIAVSGGDGDNPEFDAPDATLRLNGTVNQVLQPMFDGYNVQNLEITNPGNNQRSITIQSDVNLNTGSAGTFSATNAGGSPSNLLTVDLETNKILGNNSGSLADQFVLGSDVLLISTGSLFADDFDQPSDNSTIDPNSTVRFDGSTNQSIPLFSDANYGNIELTGTGDKYLSGSPLIVDGDVSRVGGSFIFYINRLDFGAFQVAFPSDINVAGNWELTQASTFVDVTQTSTVTFDGTSTQAISASNFDNVTFANAGTKTITGDLNVAGNVDIGANVTVTSNQDINLSGNWIQAETSSYTATGGTVLLQGGTTQDFSTNANSSFYNLTVDNNSTMVFTRVGAATEVIVALDFVLFTGSTLDLDGTAGDPLALKVSRNLTLDAGSTLSFTNNAAAIILDGDEAQNFDNEIGGDGGAFDDPLLVVPGQAFPTLRFEGVGDKDCFDNEFTILGDLFIASESNTSFGNSGIFFRGANWTVEGSFDHFQTVTFDGTASTVSSSTFYNLVVGDGTGATTVTLGGNIAVNNDITINDLSTLDVSANDYNIQVEADWRNYGTFVAQEGTVTFVGNFSQIITKFDPDANDEGPAAKAFYNLTISNAEGQIVRVEDDEQALSGSDGILQINNNFNGESGIFQILEDGGDILRMQVGGDFIFSGAELQYNGAIDGTRIIELNGAGTSSINLGGNLVRRFEVTGLGTYTLANEFQTEDDPDALFLFNAPGGTLDLEGQTMIINRAGFQMDDGTLVVDAGASLVIDGQDAGPNFIKSGGDIDLVGEAQSPATLTAVDINGFEFQQTGGDFEASNYTIANTNGAGITISGGTMTGFDNGLFTNGQGTAYMTLTGTLDLEATEPGGISADGVIFNSGPTFNIDANPGGDTPDAGSITFVVAGGSLAGENFENDDGGATTGFVRWQNDPGFVWVGGTSTDWGTASNWTVESGAGDDGNGIPDEADDIVYINSGSNDPTIDAGEGTINIGRITINSGVVTLNGGNLDVEGNVTIASGASLTFTTTESLNMTGSLSNGGDINQTANATITFDGAGGSHSITSDDPFTNLTINGDVAGNPSYALGSDLTVTNSFNLTGGSFDASSGFALNIEGDFTVAGGTFVPGTGTVDFNGDDGTDQLISGGTINNARFTGSSRKLFTGNMSVGGSFQIPSDPDDVVVVEFSSGDNIQLFVGGDWINDESPTALVPNDGRVIINGEGTQNIGGTFSTNFFDLSFQGSGNKNINQDYTLTGDLSILNPTVNLIAGNTITGGPSGIFTMSGGLLDVEDTNNFPTGFGTVSLLAGRVRYISDSDQSIQGGIAYNDLDIQTATGTTPLPAVTKTLLGDVTINSTLRVLTGVVTLAVGDNTLSINGDNAPNADHFVIQSDDIITWGTNGRLVHNGNAQWNIDADFATATTLNDVELSGGYKNLLSNLTINGEFSVAANTTFDQNTFNITGNATNTFTLGSGATYFNNSANSLPTNFNVYNIAVSSTVQLDANVAQTLIVEAGDGSTIEYGNLNLYTDADVTIGVTSTPNTTPLDVNGDFDTNSNTPNILDNNQNIFFGGSFVDLINYTPSASTTVTFDRDGDQEIDDNEGGGIDDLEFANVVFTGSGEKLVTPNGGTEVMDVSESIQIDGGVTLQMNNRGIRFAGNSFINDGTLNVPATGAPLEFDGTTAVDFNPGDNTIASLIVNLTAGNTLTLSGDLNLETGNLDVRAGNTLEFGSNRTHTIASSAFIFDPTAVLSFGGTGITTTTINLDGGTQLIPVIHEDLAGTSSPAGDFTAFPNVEGIPNLILSNGGAKDMSGPLKINDLTMTVDIANFDTQNPNTLDIHSLTVTGNWDNQGSNFVARDGQVTFYALDAITKTIDQSGQEFGEVIFDGTADRTWSLLGNIVIHGEGDFDRDMDGNEDALNIERGTLDLNGNDLTLGEDDPDRPAAELNTIGTNGALIVDAGAVLEFNTSDDDFDEDLLGDPDYEIGGRLEVNGTLTIDGDPGDAAVVTRNGGGDQIDININATGHLGMDNYSISFLTDEGLELLAGATIDVVDGGYLSNGTWNELENGSVGDVTSYLYIADITADITIDNVTFNYSGTPVIGEEYHVRTDEDPADNVITFTNISGALSNPAYDFELDPADPNTPPQNLGALADTDGALQWEALTQTVWQGTASSDWFNAANWSAGLPGATLEAVIAAGQPFNPTLDLDDLTSDLDLTLSALVVEDGILRILDSDQSMGSENSLIISGDLLIGDGAEGTLITESGVDIQIAGSFDINTNASYDNGGVTLTLNSPSPANPTFRTGNSESVGGILIDSDADYQFAGGIINIDGALTIASGSAPSINFQTNNYDLFVGGDITDTDGNATFETSTNGVVVLNGSGTQTVTNFGFDQLTVANATGVELNDVTVNDLFTIEAGATATGTGPITWNGDVDILGTFNGDDQTYTFNGIEWEGGNYEDEQGTVVFNGTVGQQYIRQTGVNPVEFHNLSFTGTSQMVLGRFASQTQFDGNVNVTGNVTVGSDVNLLLIETYLIDAVGSGTQTFTLEPGQRIDVEGVNNFPANFDIYDIDITTNVRYVSTNDQTIRSGFAYGQLELINENIKSLEGDIEVQDDLFISNGATLDVTDGNYTIRVGGRWDTEFGNNDGSFLANGGIVIFNGDGDQIVSLGNTGTQTFNSIEVDKTSGNVDLQNDLTLNNGLIIEDGGFDVNNLIMDIGGSIEISGSGEIISGGAGTINLVANTGTPTIRFNGSTFAGNLNINAPGRSYIMLDDVTIDNGMTITAGTLEVNGNTLSVGLTEDILNVFGTLNISTASRPGGTLALNNQTQLVVQAGGTVSLVGTPSQAATVTNRTNGNYGFRVTGTSGNPGNIAARYYVVEHVDENGIFVTANGLIDATNNFSNGSFSNGVAGGTYLRIENTQNFSADDFGTNNIEEVVFNDNPGGGASNVSKVSASSGQLDFANYTGEFVGEAFDNDPANLINWIDPVPNIWTGTVSRDWFTPANWSLNLVPSATDDVIIPSQPTQATLNQPIIDDGGNAVANSITIQGGNSLTTQSADNDGTPDLDVTGSITVQSTSAFASEGDDQIEIGGSLLFESIPSFNAGTNSTFIFNSSTGLVTINSPAPFHNLSVGVTGTLDLLANTTVNGDFTIENTTGSFDPNGFNFIVKGDFINSSTSSTAFVPGSGTLRLEGTGTLDFNPGNVEYYNVQMGDGTNAVTYNIIGNDLSMSNNFTLNANATLDLAGNDLLVGDENATIKIASINGDLTVNAGEAVRFGNATEVSVSGNMQLSGASGNPAVMTRKGTVGNYSIIISGEFGAEFFDISYTSGFGLNFTSGSTLTINSTVADEVDIDPSVGDSFDDIALRNGTFSNGVGTCYLNLDNSFGVTTLKSDNVIFSTGPTNNVRRTGLGLGADVIVFVDPSGTLQGPNFEIDDQNILNEEATTGNVQWFYNNPLLTWLGTNNDFNDGANWEDISGATGTPPSSSNTIFIPNGATPYPVTDADETVADATIPTGAELTISSGNTFTVTDDLSNSGTINLEGDLTVNGSLTNDGIIVPTAGSTVTVAVSQDLTFSGGSSFSNLTLIGAGPEVITTSGALLVSGDLTIDNVLLNVADPSHTLTLGGNLTLQNGGSFSDGGSEVILNGANPQLVNGLFTFNNLTVNGNNTKTLNNNVTVNGELIIEDPVTTFELGATNLTLNGDLTIDDNATFIAGTSTVTFSGTTSQRITGSNGTPNVTFNNVVMNNTNPSNSDLQLGIDMVIGGTLTLTEGVIAATSSNPLIFNDGATVAGASTASYVTGPVTKIGSGNFTFPTGDGSRFAQIGISDLTGSDSFTAEYTFGTPTDFTTVTSPIKRVSSLEFWDLSRSGSSNARVTLYYDATSEVDDTDVSALVVAHFTGGSWQNEGGTGATVTSGSVTTLNQVSSFSPFTLATLNDAQNPLPVELISFTGSLQNNQSVLKWSTALEANNAGFEVQRSGDGITFEAIGYVEGNGTTNEISNYSFMDASPLFGNNFYRLKQVDFDGASEFSWIINLYNDFAFSGMESKVYPNPSPAEEINIQVITGDNHTPIHVSIFDVNGRTVERMVIEQPSLVPNEVSPSEQLTSGTYYIIISQGSQVATEKLIVK